MPRDSVFKLSGGFSGDGCHSAFAKPFFGVLVTGHVPGSDRHQCACRGAAVRSWSVPPSVAAGGRSSMADQPSVPLVLEYEQTLKRVCAGGPVSGSEIDGVLRFLCANANLRLIFFLWRPFLPDPKDDFVLELAVESRADFLITFNTRDFVDAERFGVRVISPREFLAIIGEIP